MRNTPHSVIRVLVAALLLGASLLPLAACGRKGRPEPPPAADYPRQYPQR